MMGVRGVDAFVARWATQLRRDGMAARLVLDDERRALLVAHPAVAPSQKADDDRVKVAALIREYVLEARRPTVVLRALEHACLDQRAEPAGDEVARCAGVVTEVLEPGRAKERLAQKQQRPPVADDRQRPGDGAPRAADLGPAHANRGYCIPKWN
jgi:hypothetical protein